jgi:hypothetical protein
MSGLYCKEHCKTASQRLPGALQCNDRVPRVNASDVVEGRRLLVERVAASRYIGKSARLRDLFLYLCDRVLEGSAEQIHEQETGRNVFGRAPDYDTTSDNIVRVHASLLRKRLEQYFASEGRDEPVVIEIPKGNYAPVFRERVAVPELPGPIPETAGPRTRDWRIPALAIATVVFACSTIYLFMRTRTAEQQAPSELSGKPVVRQFWSQIIQPAQRTDIVVDDAAIGLYQELSGRPMQLSEYFDRSYLRKLDGQSSNNKLSENLAGAIVLKRYSSWAGTALLWRIPQTAQALKGQTALHFARDYSFRELKANNVILLGNSRSNPWIEPFESRSGLRWKYNEQLGIYYPSDVWSAPSEQERFRTPAGDGEHREGYSTISLLPNLGGTGSVLIVSGTGGSAVGATGDFLLDERSMSQLRALLPQSGSGKFPYFEALLRIKSRSQQPRDASVVICRVPKGS